MKCFTYLVAGLMLAAAISCKKDEAEPEPPVVRVSDIVGSWTATSAMYTNHANAGENIDVIANGGEIRFTMLNGGYVRTWIEFGALSDEWDALWTTPEPNKFISTPAEVQRGAQALEVEMENEMLIVTNHYDRFDFSLTGAPGIPATSVIVFVRH